MYADEIEALFGDSVGDQELGVLSAEQMRSTAALRASLGAYARSILSDLPAGADGDKEDLSLTGLIPSRQSVDCAFCGVCI